MRSPADMAKLAHLLEVQGQLIDAYLSQNLGERYAYLLLVAPCIPARTVSYRSNIPAEHIDAVAFYFGTRVKGLAADEILAADIAAPIPGGFGDAR